MNDSKQKVKQYIDALIFQCWQGLAHLRYFFEIDKLAEENNLLWQNGYEFLFMSSKAHLESAFACCTRLIRSNDASIYIHRFLRFIEIEAANIDNSQSEVLRAEVAKHRLTIEKFEQRFIGIISLRDQQFAHLDKTQLGNYDKLLQKLTPIADDLENIFRTIGKILSKYSEIIFEQERLLDLIGLDNVTWLFEFMENALIQERDNRGRKFS